MTTRDVDALFEHMTANQGHDMADEKEWIFSMLHEDAARLEKVGTTLADEFDVDLVTCELCDEEGNTTGERVDLLISMIAALKPDEVKSLSARFETLATEHGVEYEGVACTDPLPEDFFDWLELDDAQWRLNHLASSGWPEGEAIPFLFAIECEDGAQAAKVGAAFEADGLDGKLQEVEVIDDEEQGTGVAVQMEGVHDGAVLASAYATVEAIAQKAGATLLGVQFFGEEDEDEDEDGEG